MKKYIIFRIVLSFSLIVIPPDIIYAQNYKYQGVRLILSTNNSNGGTSFYVYKPTYLAKSIFKDTLEAKNQYPEQLMESLISANNQKWVDYNTLGGAINSKKYEKSYFVERNKLDKQTTYLELKSKYTFTFQGNEMAIIKYFYHSPDKKPISGVYVLQKLNSRWYYTSTAFTSDLAFIIMRFQEEKLALIFKGKKTGDTNIDDVISKIKDSSGYISTSKLVILFNNWYTNNSDMLTYFKDPDTW